VWTGFRIYAHFRCSIVDSAENEYPIGTIQMNRVDYLLNNGSKKGILPMELTMSSIVRPHMVTIKSEVLRTAADKGQIS